MVGVTPTAVQVEGSTTWCQLSHCTKETLPETKGRMKLRNNEEDDVVVDRSQGTVLRSPTQILKLKNKRHPLESQPLSTAQP